MFSNDLLFAIKRVAYIFKLRKQDDFVVGDGWRKAANMLAQTSH